MKDMFNQCSICMFAYLAETACLLWVVPLLLVSTLTIGVLACTQMTTRLLSIVREASQPAGPHASVEGLMPGISAASPSCQLQAVAMANTSDHLDSPVPEPVAGGVHHQSGPRDQAPNLKDQAPNPEAVEPAAAGVHHQSGPKDQAPNLKDQAPNPEAVDCEPAGPSHDQPMPQAEPGMSESSFHTTSLCIATPSHANAHDGAPEQAVPAAPEQMHSKLFTHSVATLPFINQLSTPVSPPSSSPTRPSQAFTRAIPSSHGLVQEHQPDPNPSSSLLPNPAQAMAMPRRPIEPAHISLTAATVKQAHRRSPSPPSALPELLGHYRSASCSPEPELPPAQPQQEPRPKSTPSDTDQGSGNPSLEPAQPASAAARAIMPDQAPLQGFEMGAEPSPPGVADAPAEEEPAHQSPPRPLLGLSAETPLPPTVLSPSSLDRPPRQDSPPDALQLPALDTGVQLAQQVCEAAQVGDAASSPHKAGFANSDAAPKADSAAAAAVEPAEAIAGEVLDCHKLGCDYLTTAAATAAACIVLNCDCMTSKTPCRYVGV